MDQDRAPDARTRLELGQQAIDVVDVPGALDLRHHDHVELVADLRDERRQVVEHPGRLERVDACPELRRPEVDLLADGDQAGARGLLVVDRDGILEVAEQDVRLLRDIGQLGPHLLVARVEEVDHPRGWERDLRERVRGAGCERLEEVTGMSHGGVSWRRSGLSG